MNQTFLLADNQDITRLGIRYLVNSLQSETNILETHDVQSRTELTSRLLETPSAIVVLDFALFNFSETRDLELLVNRFTEASWILFSEEMNEAFIRTLAPYPNISILFKDSSVHELQQTIKNSLRHERFLSQSVTDILLMALNRKEDQHEKLTATEVEVLRLIAQGKTVKEIAAIRFSSVHTITTHKKNIFRKINVNSVYEATKYALRNGLADMIEYYI